MLLSFKVAFPLENAYYTDGSGRFGFFLSNADIVK